MKKSNLKFIREIKQTILIGCEGETEAAFLRFIKELYVKRDHKFAVTIRNARGGSPSDIIEETDRHRDGYDNCFVLLDADKAYPMSSQYPRIKILLSTPCIEGLFLAILEKKFSQKSAKTNDCKRKFRDNYLVSRF
ncbi:MAG: RloB domain-containing protein [Elusimicrobia bacterium]|nr:RloB domain-containing protein [Elusimicrobiota bacterium]